MNRYFTGYIGVIDSGVGGLTILKQLQHDYPTCNFVYIADSAYCPYGTKSPQQILNRVQQLVRFLQDARAQAVVIACNTASCFADNIRQQFNLPIYDVIVPTCKRVADITVNKCVALLATNATVNSGVYQRILNANGIATVAFPCSSFVPFVEANAVDSLECSREVDAALYTLPNCNVDTVILGCTHFPLLSKKIAPYANGAMIVECCSDFQPLSDNSIVPDTVFLTTGAQKQANSVAKWFGQVDFVHVDI
ncbi:MAG: glutamate racemase [Clostridiales bacterium]|nr:glutamate racemase [Clostridiales bacterium]